MKALYCHCCSLSAGAVINNIEGATPHADRRMLLLASSHCCGHALPCSCNTLIVPPVS